MDSIGSVTRYAKEDESTIRHSGNTSGTISHWHPLRNRVEHSAKDVTKIDARKDRFLRAFSSTVLITAHRAWLM